MLKISDNKSLFRWLSEEELRYAAKYHYFRSRRKDIQLDDDSRDDLFISAGREFYEETKGEDFKMKVTTKAFGPIKGFGKPGRDLEYMEKFLEQSQEKGLLITEPELSRFMPGGTPAIYHLELDVNQQRISDQGGWQSPSPATVETLICKAGIASTSGSDCYYELDLPLAPNDWEFIRVNFENHIKEDQQRFPGSVLSFDIEDVRVSAEALQYLSNQNWRTQDSFKVTKIPHPKEKGAKNIPARLIMGNGVTWTAAIRFPWQIEVVKGVKRMVLRPKDFNKKVIELDSLVQFVIGSGILMDIANLKEFVRDVFGYELSMPKPVEMHALALAAGYRFPRANLFCMQLILLGGFHNKLVSCADNLWGQPFKELPFAFLRYILADVRFGHQCYTVLMSLLIRNLFPDPALVCSFLSLNQTQAQDYLVHLICTVLHDKELNQNSYAGATERKHLLLSLRERKQHKWGVPLDVSVLNRLIPPWPTVCNGGVRDFHTVSAFFAGCQAEALVELIKMIKDRDLGHPTLHSNPSRPSEDDKRYMTYGRGEELPSVLPGLASEEYLYPRAELVPKIYCLDPCKMTITEVMKEKLRTDQPRVVGVLEWVRATPLSKLREMLSHLNDLGHLLNEPEYAKIWIEKITLYQRIKEAIYYRSNEMCAPVDFLERILAGKVSLVLNQELLKENKLKATLEYEKQRHENMKASAADTARGPTGNIDLQGCHYKAMPVSTASRTLKRRRKRQKQKAKKKLAVSDSVEHLANPKPGPSRENVAFKRAPLDESQSEVGALELEDISSDESEFTDLVIYSREISDQGVTPRGDLVEQTVQPSTTWGLREIRCTIPNLKRKVDVLDRSIQFEGLPDAC